MRLMIGCLFLAGSAATVFAQAGAVHVTRDTVDAALARGGVPASMRTYSVSADGQTMTETVAYFTSEGVPAMRTNIFHRVR